MVALCAVDAIGLGALVPLPRRPPAAASTPSTLLLRALDRLESAPSSAVAASSSSRLIGSRRSTTDACAAPLPAESSSPNFESWRVRRVLFAADGAAACGYAANESFSSCQKA